MLKLTTCLLGLMVEPLNKNAKGVQQEFLLDVFSTIDI